MPRYMSWKACSLLDDLKIVFLTRDYQRIVALREANFGGFKISEENYQAVSPETETLVFIVQHKNRQNLHFANSNLQLTNSKFVSKRDSLRPR